MHHLFSLSYKKQLELKCILSSPQLVQKLLQWLIIFPVFCCKYEQAIIIEACFSGLKWQQIRSVSDFNLFPWFDSP